VFLMPNRSTRTRLLAVLAVLAAVAGVMTATTLPSPSAKAADASKFDPGMIISDQVFYDSSSLTAAQAQSFIVSKGASCTNNGSIPCLKNLVVSSPSIAANQYCSAISARSGLNAGTVFATVGKACGISPAVLITLVEKEQSLVSKSKPTSYMYQEAAGFACPDTAPCSEDYAGFFSQIYAAARQFQIYRQYPSSFNYQAGRTNNIQYNPDKGCGTKAVYIENQATAGLYDYTPYVPNAAALANLYGTGDTCSAYGNRNFWRIYSDWFGDPQNGTLKCPTFDGCVTGWTFTGTVNRKVYQDSGAKSGSGYIDLSTPTVGSSMQQSLTVPTAVGDAYQATVWVRTKAGTKTTGKFVIWGTGGSGNEAAIKTFTATSTWTQVTVNFTAAMKSHTALKVQFYLQSANTHLYLDEIGLQAQTRQPARTAVPLQSPSFESGATGWGFGNGQLNRSVVTGAAQSGTHYLATNTSVVGRSVAQDVPWPVARASAYTATIWVKTQRDKPFSGKLALWSLGGTSTVATTTFTAGSTWQPVSTTLTVTNQAATHLKVEVYENTLAPQTLLIDNVSLQANLLPNGSLESGSTGWGIHESRTNMTVYASSQVGSPGPVDGAHLGATNTPNANGSIEANVTRKLAAGDSYTATIWLRSGSAGSTFKGTLALWELGPDGNSAASAAVSVGTKWTKYTVSLTVQHSTATSLRLQLYQTANGPTVFFDGAVIH